MKRSTKYVGLAVHQATTVASVREESGRLIARGIVATEKDVLLEFTGGLTGCSSPQQRVWSVDAHGRLCPLPHTRGHTV